MQRFHVVSILLALPCFVHSAEKPPAGPAEAAKAVSSIVGHRGSSADRPENTLASYRRALEAGANIVEIDVRTTKDGVLVSMHDADVRRTTNGKGLIHELTLAELQKLDAGGWFDPKYQGERVPTVQEILGLCRGKAKVLLDLKEDGPEYVARLIAEVRKHGSPKEIVVGVRSVEQARQFRKQLPEAKQIGLIPRASDIDAFAEAGVETIRLWPHWLDDTTLVPRVRKHKLQLHLGTKQGTKEEVLGFLSYGPESLSSDDPARLIQTLAEINSGAAPAARPNIIVIMADDMGFSDIGCYGGEIQTPNLDRLAAGGLRFTQFYNTARCCPTRASLLTGLYPHQAGVGHMMEDKGKDGYRGNLNRDCVTIAEALKPSGYRSYMAGKWHVTRHIAPDGPKHYWPLQRGFDRFYGTIHGAGSFYDPYTLTRDNTQISPYADPDYKPKTYYYTDAISDHAVRFIQDHQQAHSDKPFLYVAYTAAHWPMHALEKDIAKYKGKYDGGYEPIRQARLEKARKLGLADARWELSSQAGDWGKVTDRAWEARCMEVYAAMIDNMDQGIGRIVATLEKNGQLDNTLVLYLQDNGGCAELLGRTTPKGQNAQARGDRPSLQPMKPEELPKAMAPPQTRDGWPVLMGPNVLPGPADTFIAYGQGWANVSNTPFREYKHWVHEGGISTPLIAHWPAGIKARGELRYQPGHLIDIMATCIDLGGVKYPVEYQGIKLTPLEGKSLVPAFADRAIEREALYWEHEGNRAVRIGNWKLVAKGPAGKWELYDLANDRTERHDLAAQQPERVKEMAARWETYAQRANVLPWIWEPAYPRKSN